MLSCLKYLSGGMYFKKTPHTLPFLHIFNIDTGMVQLGSTVPRLRPAASLLPRPRPAVLCLACKRQVASRENVQRPLNAILGPCKRHLLLLHFTFFAFCFWFVLFWILLQLSVFSSMPLNLPVQE